MNDYEERMASAQKLAEELGMASADGEPVVDPAAEDEAFASFEARALAAEIGMNDDADVAPMRDIDVITDEILFYKVQAGRSFLEIGRRLNEAKAQLSHGEWLPWLKEKVDISERSAQRFMKLSNEYGKSAKMADLGASKALALLALPESEREEFLTEKHVVDGEEKAVSDMTGQELTKALKERDEAVKAQRQAEADASHAEQSRAKMEEDMGLLKEKAALDHSELERLREQQKKAEADAAALREKARQAESAAEAQLRKVNELNASLEELRNKPVDVAVREPSEDELEKIRTEAQKEADAKAAKQIKDAAVAAREEAAAEAAEKVKLAEATAKEAKEAADAAAAHAEQLRKQLATADEGTAAFKVYFDNWQATFNSMLGALLKISDEEKTAKLREAIKATLTVQEGQI